MEQVMYVEEMEESDVSDDDPAPDDDDSVPDDPEPGASYFGDMTRAKSEDIIRLICLNPGNIPVNHSEADAWFDELLTNFRKYQIDVMMLQELGTNWNQVPRSQQWHEQLQS